MLYLFYGTKTFLIQNEIEKLEKKFDNLNISKYDLDSDDIKDVIEDAITISMFNDQKLIICENANMFTGQTSKDSDIIENYLNHPNNDTILVFTVNNEKIDERKKITKLIKKVGEVKCFNDDINPTTLVKNELKGYEISSNLINLIIKRAGDNPIALKNELEKLKLYKEDTKITEEDIINVISKKVDMDIFKLLDYIVQNDKNKALEIYYEILKINEEPIKIIIMLSNQFRIMYQSKELLKKGYSEKDIASTLKIHPYRVKLALQNGRKYTSSLLLKYLSELADMDMNIKTGKIDKSSALELFILKK